MLSYRKVRCTRSSVLMLSLFTLYVWHVYCVCDTKYGNWLGESGTMMKSTMTTIKEKEVRKKLILVFSYLEFALDVDSATMAMMLQEPDSSEFLFLTYFAFILFASMCKKNECLRRFLGSYRSASNRIFSDKSYLATACTNSGLRFLSGFSFSSCGYGSHFLLGHRALFKHLFCNFSLFECW